MIGGMLDDKFSLQTTRQLKVLWHMQKSGGFSRTARKRHRRAGLLSQRMRHGDGDAALRLLQRRRALAGIKKNGWPFRVHAMNCARYLKSSDSCSPAVTLGFHEVLTLRSGLANNRSEMVPQVPDGLPATTPRSNPCSQSQLMLRMRIAALYRPRIMLLLGCQLLFALVRRPALLFSQC